MVVILTLVLLLFYFVLFYALGSTMYQYFVKIVPTVYKKLNGEVRD